MWYFVVAMVINGSATVNLIPAKDLKDCEAKAKQLVEMVKADPEINKPTNTLIFSCKKIQLS